MALSPPLTRCILKTGMALCRCSTAFCPPELFEEVRRAAVEPAKKQKSWLTQTLLDRKKRLTRADCLSACAPPQINGSVVKKTDLLASTAFDMWSLGVVLYQVRGCPCV